MIASITTNQAYIPSFKGPLDFAFLVHPRNIKDIICAYPEWSLLAEDTALRRAQKSSAHVISPIQCAMNGSILHGELIAIPYTPERMYAQRREVRRALLDAIQYCENRGARIAGLGALLPSVSQAGRALARKFSGIGVTTGHTYTAIAIAEHVRAVEHCMGSGLRVVVLGAAGSTGRATVSCLRKDYGERDLVLVDLPEKHSILERVASRQQGRVQVSTSLEAIRDADILVCVTNATGALVTPDLLPENCIVIDDAQPENVSRDTIDHRPDVTVIKCLAHVPSLRCPFDLGLFLRVFLRRSSPIHSHAWLKL